MSAVHKSCVFAAFCAASCSALEKPAPVGWVDEPCPQVDVVPDLNLTEWIRASWYISQQQINEFQPTDSLYCCSATYNGSKTVPFFDGTVIGVYNYANSDKVNGKPRGGELCAREPNSTVPGKLEVAPCFLPNFFAGPYWVAIAGPSSDNYEWAVVSGGQPSVRISPTTCTTPEDGINGNGLWIFSRSQVLDSSRLSQIRQQMNELGIATTKLLDVPQAGCNYDGAFIKPNKR